MTHYYDMSDPAEPLEGRGEDLHRAVLDTLDWLDKAKFSLATLVDDRKEKESFCISSEYSFKHADSLCAPLDLGEAKVAGGPPSRGVAERAPARSDEVSLLKKANLRLQDELHCAKNKLVELQLAAPCGENAGARGGDDGESLRQLAHENAALRLENTRFREQLDTMAQQHAAFAKYGTEKLQEKAPGAGERDARLEAHGAKAAEMEIYASNMVNQLMSLEEELARQVKKNSDLARAVELFVDSVQEPLASIRESCRSVVDSGHSPLDVGSEDLPPLAPDGAEQDVHAKLCGIGDLLACAAGIINAEVQRQEELQWVTWSTAL